MESTCHVLSVCSILKACRTRLKRLTTYITLFPVPSGAHFCIYALIFGQPIPTTSYWLLRAVQEPGTRHVNLRPVIRLRTPFSERWRELGGPLLHHAMRRFTQLDLLTREHVWRLESLRLCVLWRATLPPAQPRDGQRFMRFIRKRSHF